MEDVNAHGGADGVFQDGLVVFTVELVARLKVLKETKIIINSDDKHIQWPPLNGITLGPRETDSYN
jgi:hypothetical protein